jgi:hypothetical protein
MQRKVMNIDRKDTKTYDVQMNETGTVEMEYDLQGTKMFVIDHVPVRQNGSQEAGGTQPTRDHIQPEARSKEVWVQSRSGSNERMQQMIDREFFDLIHRDELNDVEKRHAMESLIFLSEKKDRLIKAWQCANGSTQRSYIER